ncbi:hypothetical protein RSOLAG22IIIB_12198 [Rhizoctonia solani]|uniref:Ricin B lectin domain-containing protein n=1 Tax=Rhizoctonia solani TaxID=456999 RepID=A0A0K6GCV7_9AGAM|nr:hypothetical protein RSOLAG22IIIB_12198 [Rhizoctonia solani]
MAIPSGTYAVQAQDESMDVYYKTLAKKDEPVHSGPNKPIGLIIKNLHDNIYRFDAPDSTIDRNYRPLIVGVDSGPPMIRLIKEGVTGNIEEWVIEPADDGWFRIRSPQNSDDRCWTTSEKGQPIYLKPSEDKSAKQLWKFTPAD